MTQSKKKTTASKAKLAKEIVFFAGIAIILLLEFIWFYGGGFNGFISHFQKPRTAVPGIILFYGNNCDQCANVDTFIKNNNVAGKVAFTELEVFNNTANANLLQDKSQKCGLDPSQIGVPFLWDGKNCFIGYVDVIKFFQSKIAKNP